MDRKIYFLVSMLSLLVAAEARSSGIGEEFPVAKFGQPPAKPEGGVPRLSAADEAEEWSGGTHGGTGRGLASARTGSTNGGTIIDAQTGSDLDAILKNHKGVQELAVIANDLGYFPKTLFVNRDVPVRMFVTGASKNSLCLMMDSFQVRKQIRSQRIEEITFTPNTPGRYRFYCPMNGMEGTLIVRELVSNTPTQ